MAAAVDSWYCVTFFAFNVILMPTVLKSKSDERTVKSCSHCTFTAQFESALKMHKQLHHDKDSCSVISKTNKLTAKKSSTLPRASLLSPTYHNSKTDQDTKSLSLKSSLGRTSSATRLLDKLRARICRSRTLFSHPEEDLDTTAITIMDSGGAVDTSMRTECSPKPAKAEPSVTRLADINVTSQLLDEKETFGCHMCKFDADRITVLDRHLLNYHKIGLENLLKLVMAKTKDGLSEEDPKLSLYGIRRPYYKLPDEIIEDGEFIIETVTPKIKILKHAATNTEIQWSDIPDLKNNCQMITAELEKLIKYPLEKCDKEEFLGKMQTLNECMCKFVDSSNTLKKVLAIEFDSNLKHNVREQPFFDLCLGDRNKSRMWDRAHSDQIDRSRSKYGENNKGDKKFSSESFYF